MLTALLFSALLRLSSACSNIIVSPGASVDGSSIISYNADSGSLYGSLYHYPAGDHPSGTMRNIYDWDSGAFLGQIPEVPHTYNVVGNMNEFGLVIGETTFGGAADLQSQPGAIMDYGSLIWVTLQRATNARSAIKLMGELMATNGYASEGESFSIGDPNEVWIMELIGKGAYEMGAVWVARRVPDGYITGHANQARITTFPMDDPDNCIYSPDVVSFARSIGLYPASHEEASDADFSFSDVYDAVTFSGARFCEARVWTFFSAIMGPDFASQYQDYAQGYNLTNRMPLWVQPPAAHSLSLANVSQFMRDHYENTWFDMTGTREPDAGAMDWMSPQRIHPLTWSYNGLGYVNERPIATQQTGWNFVAQSRANVAAPLAGLLWFGVDDSSTTVHFPIYGSATRVPLAFAGQGAQDGVTTPILEFSMDNAFSVFNLMANWVYQRWDAMYPEVYDKILAIETGYAASIVALEKEATDLLKKDNNNIDIVIELLTAFSETTGNALVKEWGAFFGSIFMKYRDGYVITPNPEMAACGCDVGSAPYSNQWYGRIVTDTGDRYLDPTSVDAKRVGKEFRTHTLQVGSGKPLPVDLQPVDKKTLRALQ